MNNSEIAPLARILLKRNWQLVEKHLTDPTIPEKLAQEKRLSPKAKAWLKWAQHRLYDAIYTFTWESS